VIGERRELKKLQIIKRERELSIARLWRLSPNPKWITESESKREERDREEIFKETK
jgi:hypothetical protein